MNPSFVGGVLLVVMNLCASTARAADCAPELVEGSSTYDQARFAFELGTRALEGGDARLATRAFNCSLELRSESLPALFNLALAYERLGHPARALETLDRHDELARAEHKRKNLKASERLRLQIRKASSVQLEVSLLGRPDRFSVDGVPYSVGEHLSLTLALGDHLLEAAREGFEPASYLIAARRGGATPVELNAAAHPIDAADVRRAPVAKDDAVQAGAVSGNPETGIAAGTTPDEVHALDPAPALTTVSAPPAATRIEVPAASAPVAEEGDNGLLGKPWFWVVVGAVAAGGVAGTALLLSDHGGHPGPAGIARVTVP